MKNVLKNDVNESALYRNFITIPLIKTIEKISRILNENFYRYPLTDFSIKTCCARIKKRAFEMLKSFLRRHVTLTLILTVQ